MHRTRHIAGDRSPDRGLRYHQPDGVRGGRLSEAVVDGVSSGDPLVSLIMPVWRPRPEWLAQAVESALGQRGCRIELVLVDDGSPEPVEGLLSWVRDERLRIIRIEHGGVSRARNAGIVASTGSRLRFIDCDDVLDLDSTARLLRLMGDDEDVIAYGATILCDAALRPQGKIASLLEGRAVIACLLNQDFTVMLQAMLFSRHIVQAAGDWDPAMKVCEDWDFVLRALEHTRVRGEDMTALYYRRHADAAASNSDVFWQAGQGPSKVVSRYLERHPEARGTRLEMRMQAMLDVLRADHVTGGRPWRSSRFWKAALFDPHAALPRLRRHLRLMSRMKGLLRRTVRLALPSPVRRWVLAQWRDGPR
jgi:glycosyltransferase involved in cell wall biosynthesis